MAEPQAKPVAVVMGAGPGLGASLARRFAERYAVAVNARRPDYLRTLADEIRAQGGHALEAPGDVGDREQVAEVFKLIRRQVGEPEVLLFNAAAGPFGNVSEVTPEQFENCMRVNALGAFLCAKECVPGDGGARPWCDPVYRSHRRSQSRRPLGRVRAWEFRQARPCTITSARSGAEGNPRGMDQRRWRDRPAQSSAAEPL
jgi:NAD(P)-dependent dehydrogenase (short-subunit alcohol dehydrogenase family)